MARGRKQTSVESIALNNLPKGSIFHTQKQDNDMTAIGSYYGKKISTERLITINPITAHTERIVKVIIL